MEFTETKDAVEALNDRIENLEADIIDLTIEKNKYRDRLEESADILANLDIITNTPYAKRKWIEGE
jgi:hypothetical protein